MEDKPNNDKLAAALVAFQSEVPEVKKTRTAKIPTKSGTTYSYQFADLGDIWAAIRKPLAGAKLAVVQTLSGGREGLTQLTTIVMHESGQQLESVLDLSTSGKTPQEAGSLFTYYKRYALSAALGISTEEDDDAQAANTPPKKPPVKPAVPAEPRPTAKQLDTIRELSAGLDLPEEKTEARIKQITTMKQATEAIQKLQDMQPSGTAPEKDDVAKKVTDVMTSDDKPEEPTFLATPEVQEQVKKLVADMMLSPSGRSRFYKETTESHTFTTSKFTDRDWLNISKRARAVLDEEEKLPEEWFES